MVWILWIASCIRKGGNEMAEQRKDFNKDIIHLGIMILIIAFFWLSKPFGQALTPVGMKVLGVFLAGCYGWTTAGTFWPSILCICLLYTSRCV